MCKSDGTHIAGWAQQVSNQQWFVSSQHPWLNEEQLSYVSVSSRFTPKNLHQRPTVALLCGPHVQGAQGISCGRHLANHEVEVILFLPNFVKMLDSVTSELTLFNKTGGQQVSSIKGGHIFLILLFCSIVVVVFNFFPPTPQTSQTVQ